MREEKRHLQLCTKLARKNSSGWSYILGLLARANIWPSFLFNLVG
jgi:hypothetical protein